MIKSVYDNQSDILSAILRLNGLANFDADITYGNGSFYKDIKPPMFRYDIDPQMEDVTKACSTNLPLDDGCLSSIVFDPPFLTYVKAGREHSSIMAKRFGGYWAYSELEEHYKKTLSECRRVLKKKGILVFKCQDIIHNHKLHPTHVNVINWASLHFRLKDLFILAAKNRMAVNRNLIRQQHARIHHSYFLVLEAK